MSKRIFLINSIVLCLLASLASCKREGMQMAPESYKTISVSKSSCTLNKEYTCVLKGRQNVEIRPQVSGTITQICVSEGATVRKGQILFILDQVPYRAALNKAVASVNSAKAGVANSQLTLKSKQQLRERQVVSDFDVEQAQNNYNQDNATLQNAKAAEIAARNDLSYTEVKSPADGVIGMIPYRVGALVSSSIENPLATVSDNSDIYAYFSITESEMQQLINKYGSLNAAVKQMPAVKLRLSDRSEYKLTGTVDAISGNVDASTGTVSLRATFPNPDDILRNGGSGTIVMPYDMKDVIVIPQEATYDLQDRTFVYKIVNNKTKSSEIEIVDFNDGKQYIVTGGLKKGEVIIAEGAGLLHDGIEVKPNK